VVADRDALGGLEFSFFFAEHRTISALKSQEFSKSKGALNESIVAGPMGWRLDRDD
jgi:hypothetical protein